MWRCALESRERVERFGGVALLGIPTFDFFVGVLDTYGRGELLMNLREQLPSWLLNPAFVFLCMSGGLALLYASHNDQLRRIFAMPPLVGVEQYRKKERPGWLLPLLCVAFGALIAAPGLALKYSLAYKGTTPPAPRAHFIVPTPCKTADCFASKPGRGPIVYPTVNVTGVATTASSGGSIAGLQISDNSQTVTLGGGRSDGPLIPATTAFSVISIKELQERALKKVAEIRNLVDAVNEEGEQNRERNSLSYSQSNSRGMTEDEQNKEQHRYSSETSAINRRGISKYNRLHKADVILLATEMQKRLGSASGAVGTSLAPVNTLGIEDAATYLEVLAKSLRPR